jgi:hypothetical protein
MNVLQRVSQNPTGLRRGIFLTIEGLCFTMGLDGAPIDASLARRLRWRSGTMGDTDDDG